MPESGLAAVVIAAALSLFDLGGVAQLARIRRTGVRAMSGLLRRCRPVRRAHRDLHRHRAVTARLRATAWRAPTTPSSDGSRAPRGITTRPGIRRHARYQGLIIYRFDSPLFFANADHFRDHIRNLVTYANPPARWVVVAAEPITDIDTTAAEMLVTLDEELSAADVQLAFAELKGHVRDRLRSYGVADRFTDDRFFPTLGTTVRAYLAATGVGWSDWEDEASNPT